MQPTEVLVRPDEAADVGTYTRLTLLESTSSLSGMRAMLNFDVWQSKEDAHEANEHPNRALLYTSLHDSDDH